MQADFIVIYQLTSIHDIHGMTRTEGREILQEGGELKKKAVGDFLQNVKAKWMNEVQYEPQTLSFQNEDDEIGRA